MIKPITNWLDLKHLLDQGVTIYDANLSYRVKSMDGQFFIVNPDIHYIDEMLDIERHSLFIIKV